MQKVVIEEHAGISVERSSLKNMQVTLPFTVESGLHAAAKYKFGIQKYYMQINKILIRFLSLISINHLNVLLFIHFLITKNLSTP